MRHKYCASYDGIVIRPLCRNDIEFIRQWRNDKELSKFLTPVGEITPKMQSEWFQEYETDKDTIFFAVADMNSENIIGTVALYEFNGASCEAGKIVIGDDSKRGKGIGYASLLMAMCIGIKYFKVEKYRLRVCAENTVAYNMYLKTGFRETGRHPFNGNLTEVSMEISKAEFEKSNPLAEKIYLYIEGQTK